MSLFGLAAWTATLSLTFPQQAESARGSEAYYEEVRAYWQAETVIASDATLLEFVDWPLYLLEDPTHSKAEVEALPLLERLTWAESLRDLSRELDALRPRRHAAASTAARLARAHGDLARETESWLAVLEVAQEPDQVLLAKAALGQTYLLRNLWKEALRVYEVALQEAEHHGLEEHVSALEARAGQLHIVLRIGHAGRAATLEGELWQRANLALERDPNLLGVWLQAAVQHLAVPLALRRYVAVETTFERDIRPHAAWNQLTETDRALIWLRVAMAAVDGLRGGNWPGEDPRELLAERVLPHLEPPDDFLARWWWARAELDRYARGEAELDGVEPALASLREDLNQWSSPAYDRPRRLETALRAAIERERGAPAPGTLQALEVSWSDFLDTWANTRPEEGGVGFLSFEEWNMLGSELILAYVQRGQTLAALGILQQARERGGLARRLGARALEGEALERRLAELRQPGEVLLIYGLGRETCHLFVYGDRGLEHHALGSDYELEASAKDAERYLEDSLELQQLHPQLEPALKRAGSAFLPPGIRATVAEHHALAIVGIDSFGFVPFELLGDGDRPLGVTHELRYLPSLAVGDVLARRRTPLDGREFPARRELLVVAAPEVGVPEAKQAAFRFGASETKQLTGGYREAEALIGGGATLEAVLEAAPETWRIGQFIVHGQIDTTRPRPAGLRLAGPDGPRSLWPDQAETQGLCFSPLTILITCSAGQAPLRRGDDGVAHLGSLALLNGAHTVLLPRGSIGLEPSLELTERFHRGLRAGETPAAALHQARAQLYAAATPIERLHHGALHLIGLADEPLFAEEYDSRNNGRGAAVAISLGFVLAVAAFALRRSFHWLPKP